MGGVEGVVSPLGVILVGVGVHVVVWGMCVRVSISVGIMVVVYHCSM